MMALDPVVQLDRSICSDLDESSSREWWLTNGIGGYASGTLSGILNRRYHGLLVAPFHPPLGRYLLMAKADAVLIDGEKETPLHSNRWGGAVVEPQGYHYIDSFSLEEGTAVWRFVVDDLKIEQRIWMEHGQNCTHIAFRLLSGEREKSPRIRLGLIAAFRDHHSISGPGSYRIEKTLSSGKLTLDLSDNRSLEIRSNQGSFQQDDSGIENFFLASEHARGLENIDNHHRVGFVDVPLQQESYTGFSIALDGVGEADLEKALKVESQRVASLAKRSLPGLESSEVPAWIKQLALSADAFVFRRLERGKEKKRSIIAGYPWFGDWGRDTMIALPGLTLATGRPEVAKEILLTFSDYVSQGMLPNVFPGDGEEPEYNTVDAALWFIEAWRAYFEATDDWQTLASVLPVLQEVIDAYSSGTRFGIAMDPSDSLIRAGEPGQQLTWMDARVDGREITPRHGKPVEINALWYNALCSMAIFTEKLGQPSMAYAAMAESVVESFSRFHRGEGAGLFDVIDGPYGDDSSIRPNQIFALSLPYSPLETESVRHAVLSECKEHLLTPYGLRSLSPQDPNYSGQYIGGVVQRDGSYHQGPVWGWLLGYYAMAEFRVTGNASMAQQRLVAMRDHLGKAGLGQISEIFDGDLPHTPRGAPAQAWSVACTLEAWWRLELE